MDTNFRIPLRYRSCHVDETAQQVGAVPSASYGDIDCKHIKFDKNSINHTEIVLLTVQENGGDARGLLVKVCPSSPAPGSTLRLLATKPERCKWKSVRIEPATWHKSVTRIAAAKRKARGSPKRCGVISTHVNRGNRWRSVGDWHLDK